MRAADALCREGTVEVAEVVVVVLGGDVEGIIGHCDRNVVEVVLDGSIVEGSVLMVSRCWKKNFSATSLKVARK